MAVTQYIGARYVPLLADPVEWSSTKSYEPLTIVTHEGNSYTSRQYVPVGIDISRDEFWALTGNYNAQVEMYRGEVNELSESLDESVSSLNSAMGTLRDDVNSALTEMREEVENDITTLQEDVSNTLDEFETQITELVMDEHNIVTNIHPYFDGCVSFQRDSTRYKCQGGCYIENGYYVMASPNEGETDATLFLVNTLNYSLQEITASAGTLTGHFNGMAFSPNTRRVYCCGLDTTLHIFLWNGITLIYDQSVTLSVRVERMGYDRVNNKLYAATNSKCYEIDEESLAITKTYDIPLSTSVQHGNDNGFDVYDGVCYYGSARPNFIWAFDLDKLKTVGFYGISEYFDRNMPTRELEDFTIVDGEVYLHSAGYYPLSESSGVFLLGHFYLEPSKNQYSLVNPTTTNGTSDTRYLDATYKGLELGTNEHPYSNFICVALESHVINNYRYTLKSDYPYVMSLRRMEFGIPPMVLIRCNSANLKIGGIDMRGKVSMGVYGSPYIEALPDKRAISMVYVDGFLTLQNATIDTSQSNNRQALNSQTSFTSMFCADNTILTEGTTLTAPANLIYSRITTAS